MPTDKYDFYWDINYSPKLIFSIRSVKLTEHRRRRHHHHPCGGDCPYMSLLFIVTFSIIVIFISDVIYNVLYHRRDNLHCHRCSHSRQRCHHPYFHHYPNHHRHYRRL